MSHHLREVAHVDQRAAQRAHHLISQVLPQAFEEGMPDFAFGRLRAVFDLGQQLWLEDFDSGVSQMDPDAVAIEFVFVNPAVPGWHLVYRSGNAGSMNAGKGAFTPIASGFLR
jgi:hypothetical protein